MSEFPCSASARVLGREFGLEFFLQIIKEKSESRLIAVGRTTHLDPRFLPDWLQSDPDAPMRHEKSG
jgi:hypothetical protein